VSEDRSHTPAERAIWREVDGVEGVGKPLSRSSMERARTLEGYLKGNEPPAWMRRARQIGRLTKRHERELEAAREALLDRHAGSPTTFAREWRALVRRWSFGDVNELIEIHNEWYPVERRLPIHPRTGEYVTVGGGRSFVKEPLSVEWALRRFPATP
jgi:hypothetical protein